MNMKRSALAIITFAMVAGLVACSSGNSNSGGGGGGNNPISVALSGTPPTSLPANGTTQFTATVTNDSANAGVSWSASCATSGGCGSFSPTSTASGTATTYTAPAVPPSGGTVTITATSVTDGTKKATATVTITNTLADGNYVFSLSGSNTGGVFYDVAGVVTIAGGVITTGEQDYVDGNNADLHDAINPSGSGYTTTTDGNLQLTLVTCLGQDCTQTDSVIGGGTGSETINGTIVSASSCSTSGGPCKARIVEFDAFATSSGVLELQDSTAAATAPTGAYAFAAQGIPASLPVAVGGIMNISGATVSTSGTVFDLNNGGTVSMAQTISGSLVTAPDSLGRYQISMTPTAALPTLSFAAYIVDASHTLLVEAASPLGGIAFAQAANPSASGNSYVIGMTGGDGVGPLQAAGVFTLAQGAIGVTGTFSYNDLVNLQSPAIAVTGTYSIDNSNPGRYTLNSVTDGTNTFDLGLYVDGNGNALAISLGAGVVLEGAGGQQTSVAGLSGSYVLSATGFDGSNAPFELDAVGPVTTGSGTFSGFVDLNWLGSSTLGPNSAVSGAFSTPNASGVSSTTGDTLTGLDVLLGASQKDDFDYYVVNANTVIGIEIDSNQNTLATFDLVQ